MKNTNVQLVQAIYSFQVGDDAYDVMLTLKSENLVHIKIVNTDNNKLLYSENEYGEGPVTVENAQEALLHFLGI